MNYVNRSLFQSALYGMALAVASTCVACSGGLASTDSSTASELNSASTVEDDTSENGSSKDANDKPCDKEDGDRAGRGKGEERKEPNDEARPTKGKDERGPHEGGKPPKADGPDGPGKGDGANDPGKPANDCDSPPPPPPDCPERGVNAGEDDNGEKGADES